jgi:uncharacterized membrane protein
MHIALGALDVPAADAERVLAASSRTPDALEWRQFLATLLLVLGAGLALSGIVSFFAFNWAALGRLSKMGLIAAAMSACAVVALRQPTHLVSRVLLFAASVLLGALLAVFGQSYQTGADPWALFAVWALLILPWALAATFTPLWLLVIALIDVGYGLYVGQVLELSHWDVTLMLGVVAVHVLAVMAFEAQHLRQRPWLTDTWAPRSLIAATFLLLLGPSLMMAAYPESGNRLGAASLGTLTFLIVLVGAFYRLVRPDAFMLTAVAGSVMAVVTTAIGRVVMVTLDLGVLGFMVMTGLLVLEVTLVVSWLRKQALEEAA